MKRKIMIAVTLMLAGRAMTLAFIASGGGTQAGDPPAAWLMPLVGDAVIGLTALGVAYLIARKRGLGVWVSVVVWNSLAIWDAMSAFAIHTTNPWNEFFMLEIFGPSMFFMASLMHAGLLVMAFQPDVREQLLGRPDTFVISPPRQSGILVEQKKSAQQA